MSFGSKIVRFGIAFLALSSTPALAEQSIGEYQRLCSQQSTLVFRRQYSQALVLLNNWIASGERLPQAYKLRCETYTAMKSCSLAIADANKAIELDSNFRPAYIALATVYTRVGDYDNATNCWQASLKRVDPSRTNEFPTEILTDSTSRKGAWEHTNLGYIYSKKSDDVTALKEFEQAINLEPTNCTEAYFLSGPINERHGKLEEALRDFQHASGQDPCLISAFRHCAALAEALGRKADAANYNTLVMVSTPANLWSRK